MPEPLRVLFLNSCVSGGGAGRSLVSLLGAGDGRIEASVVMPGRGVIAAHLEGKARLYYLPLFVERLGRSPYRWPDRLGIPWAHPAASLWALAGAARGIGGLARRIGPHLIYCNHMLAKPVGAAVGSRLGIPVVFHSRAVHHLRADDLFYSWLGARSSVRLIICNSEAAARVYRRRSDPKVRIVPNGIDTELFSRSAVTPALRKELGIPADSFVAGFVGRLHPKKGVDWLIESFASFAGKDPRRFLVVVGENDGSLHYDARERYRALAQRLGLGDRVRFTGFRDDVRPLIAGFDVLVFPSRLPESFGRVLIEAMALEVPVVTSAQGGSTEVVRRGVDGLWVAIDDRDGLARALDEMASKPEARRAMAAAGRERVLALYDRRVLARRITDLLVETAAGSRTRS